MRKFFSAILNEWRQHWRLLLILFAAQALLILIIIEHCLYLRENSVIFYLFMLVLCCYIPVAMAPNMLTVYLKPHDRGIIPRVNSPHG